MQHFLISIFLFAATYPAAIAQTTPHTSDVHIISSPQSGYVIRGERFETEIFVLAGGRTLPDKKYSIEVNGISLLPENGRVRYSAIAGSIGLNRYTVKANIRLGSENIALSRTFSYEVGERSVYVSADRMNVFYVGVDNPVSVSAAGFSSKDLKVSINGSGGTITRTGSAFFNVRVETPTEDCRVNVTGGGLSDSRIFRVKRIPDPSPVLSELTLPEQMDADKFKSQGGVILMLKDFDFDARCDMLSFEVLRIAPDGARESVTNEGGRFREAARALVDKAEPGDIFLFRNIRGQYPGDAEVRNLQGFSVEIR